MDCSTAADSRDTPHCNGLHYTYNELHVSFLDVGQGDAILIRQGNQEVLVDGGPDTQAISRELGKQLPSGIEQLNW